jgi:hypothetical protein
MLLHLDRALEKPRAANRFTPERDLMEAIEDGAVLRARPKTTGGFTSPRVRWRLRVTLGTFIESLIKGGTNPTELIADSREQLPLFGLERFIGFR